MEPINEVADRAIDLDRRIKAINEEAAVLKKQLNDAKEELLTMMQETGTKAIKLSHGSVSSSRVLNASVQDEQAFMAWLKKNDVDPASYRSWNRSAVRSFMIEHIDNGTPLPDGLKGFEGVSLRFAHAKEA